MIVLIDNENYMIRLCKDDPNIHGFHPSFPNWKNLAKFLSDAGDMVVLSGDEQEEWLDENNIYYVHVEHKPKESFETFKKRMYRQIKENQEYVDSSMSFGKLVYALTKDSYEKGSINSDNVIEVWRANSDDKYHLRLDLPDNISNHTYYLLVRIIRKRFEADTKCGEQMIGVSELTSPSFNLFTADTLSGISVRLQVLEELFKNDRIDVPEMITNPDPREFLAACKALDDTDVGDLDSCDENCEEESEVEEPEEVKGDCNNCDDYGCPANPNYDENFYSDDEDEPEEEADTEEEYPEEVAAPEEEEVRDNPQHINQCNDCPYECPCDEDPADCPLDNAEEHEEDVEDDEDCEKHCLEETEDENGNSVYKVNGKEVSKEEFEDAMKDSLISMFKALAKAFGKED